MIQKTALECGNPDCPFSGLVQKFLRRRNAAGILAQGRWYCGPDCFEQAVTGIFSGLVRLPEEPLPLLHRVPLGLLLMGRGVITYAQLKSALQAQRKDGMERLGRWLIRQGVVSAQDVSAGLAAQWGCATFPLDHDRRYRECSQMLPLALLESARMIPVHYLPESQLLFVGFSEDIDHTALYAIEQLTGSRTEPCIVTESAMARSLEDIRNMPRQGEIVFETIRDPREMVHAVRDYALKLGAEELILARPRKFLWVRLRARGHFWDLMFRLPAGTPA